MKGRTKKRQTKKLTKDERSLDEKMLTVLQYAVKRGERWHDIGKDPQWRRATQLLAERGASLRSGSRRISVG
jgi:hypothetical protein